VHSRTGRLDGDGLRLDGAILEQAIEDAGWKPKVRMYALLEVRELLRGAIEQGYVRWPWEHCRELVEGTQREIRSGSPRDDDGEIEAAADLCTQLAQAVTDGYFGDLRDF